MIERYDIAIIGSGPAGLSAAINGKIRNRNVVVFGQKSLSNKLIKAPNIDNYLGFYNISGEELKNKFQQHIDSMGISIIYERINNIYAMGDYFSLMANDKTYEATTVILATGVEFTKPLPGELEFLGRGVGYCATCDAPLYKGKIVTIIGHNKESEEEANFVSELASKLYFIPIHKGPYDLRSTIEVVKDVPKEIVGEELVKKLILQDTEILTDGIFILKDSVSPAQLVPGINVENDHIAVTRKMETNIPGLYAAGDCVGRPYQYIKSAGEGLIAALSAVSYVDKMKK